MIPVYHGWDDREEYGSHVFCSSLIRRSSAPVSLIPLRPEMFASFYPLGQRDGTNSFTYTRFLIPFLQGFTGWAIFADGADMICRCDIAELWAQRDEYKAVQVVGHTYKTRHPRKYIGTAMESDNRDYYRKNWSSLMLINCASFGWRQMTPERVAAMPGEKLHRFDFIDEDRIGQLPAVWGWMPQEFGDNPDAKIIHYTAGSPGFPAYARTEMADAWAAEACRVTHVTA
jgi:hypothetical protein